MKPPATLTDLSVSIPLAGNKSLLVSKHAKDQTRKEGRRRSRVHQNVGKPSTRHHPAFWRMRLYAGRKDDDVAAFTRTRVSPALATTPHSGECGYTRVAASD